LPEVGSSLVPRNGGACVPVNMVLHPRRLGSVTVISTLSVQDISVKQAFGLRVRISRGGGQD
jgi:hypothetical protein